VAIRNMGVILGFTGISSVLLGLHLRCKIVVPSRQLTTLIKHVQDEKFHINVDVTGKDEIGGLGRFINRMMDQIRVFNDLKVRHIAEERRRSEVLANLLHERVILADSHGRVRCINPAALDFFGLSQPDVEGRFLKDIPLDGPFRQALLRSVDAHEGLQDRVIALVPSNGGAPLRKIVLSTAFVRDENGEIMSIVSVFHEIEYDNDVRGSGDEMVKEVVEELAGRLQAALQVKDDDDNVGEKREEREVV
jgi:nitrogen fixation/metabolism regulation signal transduction histidine kinase